MKEIKEIIASLYNDYLLRDLFAKVVPGTIVLSVALYGTDIGNSLYQISKGIGGASIFLAIGAAWITAYAIQQVGEILKLIKHHPKKYNDSKIRYATRLNFKRLASNSDIIQVERFAVIKEATGNAATALLVVIIVIVFKNKDNLLINNNISFYISTFSLFVLSIALFRANRSHAIKHYAFIEEIIAVDSKIEVIVFDFDGVIIDSMPTQGEAWEESINSMMDELDTNQSKGILNNFWLGKADKDIFHGLEISQVVEDKLRTKKDNLWDKKKETVTIFKGVDSTLKELSEHFILAIATTAPRKYVEDHLDKNGIRGFFSVILTNKDVKNPKPSPDLLNTIAKTTQVSINSIIMIGDTENDAKMAKNAGCQFYMLREHIIQSQKPADVRVLANWYFLEKELLKNIQIKS
jgi:HAD superfamily hydrolase (TIGR01549 family)